MAATSQNLICYMGDTTSFPVHITEDGNNFDISGHHLIWIISKSNASGNLLQKVITPAAAPGDEDSKQGISSLDILPTDLVTIGGVGNYWLTMIDADEDDLEVTRIIKQLVVHARVSVSGFSGFSGYTG